MGNALKARQAGLAATGLDGQQAHAARLAQFVEEDLGGAHGGASRGRGQQSLAVLVVEQGVDKFGLAAGELAGLHVALQHVDAFLLIEGDAGDFVETNDVVLGDETALPGAVVDEHVGDRCFAARDEVGVGRHLLEEV